MVSRQKGADGAEAKNFQDAAPSWAELEDLVAAKRKRLNETLPDLEGVRPAAILIASSCTGDIDTGLHLYYCFDLESNVLTKVCFH